MSYRAPSWSVLIRYEWMLLRRGAAFWLATTAFCGLALLGIAFGAARTACWESSQETLLAEQEARLQDLRNRVIATADQPESLNTLSLNYAIGGNDGMRYALKPIPALAALAVGETATAPVHYAIQYVRKEALMAPPLTNPHHLAIGQLDLSFILVVLYPLLPLTLGYGLLSAEREGGILSLTLSQPISQMRLTLAKLAPRAGVILVFSIVIPIAVWAVSPDRALSSAIAARVFLCQVLLALYGVFWLVLAAGIGGKHASSDATLGAASWVTLAILLPSSLNVAAAFLYPLPPTEELSLATRQSTEQAGRISSQLLKEYFEAHPDHAPGPDKPAYTANDGNWVMYQEEIARGEALARSRFREQVQNREQMISVARFFSPPLALWQALEELADTSPAAFEHFRRQADDYEAEWKRYYVPRTLSKIKFTAADFDAIPTFRWNPRPLRVVAAATAPCLAALLAALAFALWALKVRGRMRAP